MKNVTLVKSLFKTLAVLTLVSTIISCKKNDVDESGSANIKVVNAATTAPAQSFSIAGKTIVQGGLTFGSGSDGYIAANSGNNLVINFKSAGSANDYANGKFDLDNGAYYTAFLAGEGQSARIKLFKDDLSAPSSGKAKVRFIHLSDAAPSNIDIRSSATTNVVVNLSKDNASNYLELEPGIMSLQVFETGGNTSLGTFNLSAFASGKIYTVYVAGTSSANISVHQVSHN